MVRLALARRLFWNLQSPPRGKMPSDQLASKLILQPWTSNCLCLDIPFGMLHHFKLGLRRYIQFLTLYFLHFSSTTPLWKISNSLPSTVSAARSTIPAFNCSWITALHSSILFDFSSSEKGLLVFVGYARRLSESRLVALISLPGKVILQPSFV